jgi:MraZ protein
MAFRGTFDYSLDAKNRLTVPAKFRASLSEGVVLAKGVEPCVELWRPKEFEDYVAQALEGWPPLSAQREKLELFFSANALDTELDAAGRVMVPAFLMEHAGLSKEAVVTGAGKRLQVWDRAAWSTYNDSLIADVADIRAQLVHPA